MAYKLEFHPSSQVHPTFHLSFLKKVIGDKIPFQTILLGLYEKGKIILEFEKINETIIKQLWNQTITEYLIKWKNLPIEDLTWEDKFFIHKNTHLLNH